VHLDPAAKATELGASPAAPARSGTRQEASEDYARESSWHQQISSQLKQKNRRAERRAPVLCLQPALEASFVQVCSSPYFLVIASTRWSISFV
jgi:hypothetical protein